VRCASDWAWFVECKIIDGAASLRLYQTQGIARFLSGEYAAGMPTAAMIGYCRDGTSAVDVLPLEFGTGLGTADFLPGTCLSIHRRRNPPGGVIGITHLWLPI